MPSTYFIHAIPIQYLVNNVDVILLLIYHNYLTLHGMYISNKNKNQSMINKL